MADETLTYPTFKEARQQGERELISRVLAEHPTRKDAAHALGMTYSALATKMSRLGMKPHWT